MLHNYHTHTSLCGHATGSMREYVEKAIEAGLKTLGFSDHAAYAFTGTNFVSGVRMRFSQAESYAREVRDLAKEYEKEIRILCGFEAEYYPKFFQEQLSLIKSLPLDYLIMGQHFIDNEADTHRYVGYGADESVLEKYVDQALEGLATGAFLYLAHPDLPGWGFSTGVAETQYRKLCEGAKALGVPLEMNLLGIRDGRHYPSKRFFEIAADVGNDIVLGIDAHSPQEILDTRAIRIAKETVLELGLRLIETPLL